MPDAATIDDENTGSGGDDIVSTPEGDNEFTADEPVAPVEGLQVPNGNAPSPYMADQPGEVKEAVDKLSMGQILT